LQVSLYGFPWRLFGRDLFGGGFRGGCRGGSFCLFFHRLLGCIWNSQSLGCNFLGRAPALLPLPSRLGLLGVLSAKTRFPLFREPGFLGSGDARFFRCDFV
jgi:hypothetical protein